MVFLGPLTQSIDVGVNVRNVQTVRSTKNSKARMSIHQNKANGLFTQWVNTRIGISTIVRGATMKLAELFETITYRASLVGPETDMEEFEDCVEQRLYIRGSYFLKWYLRPEQWFSQGGIIIRAYQGDALIGIGILNRKSNYLETSAEPIDRQSQVFVGIIGFFVKPEHRGQGIAVRLAQELEREFLKTYRLHWLEPVVIATGDAQPVARRGFRKLKAVNWRQSFRA